MIDTGRRAPHRNHGCRIRDFVWGGRRCLSMENANLRAVFCVDKGCDLLELTYKPTDSEVLHQAPAGLAAPLDRAGRVAEGGDFRDQFPGGWYLMLPNGPRPCEHRGAVYGHHGEATFLAWTADVLDDHPDRVSVAFHTRLRRTPIAVARIVTLERNSSTLVIEEALTSEAGHTIEALWGHHPTFGGDLVAPGTRLDLPNCKTSTAEAVPADAGVPASASGRWPMVGHADLSRVSEEGVRLHDFVRLEELSSGWFALSNAAAGVGFALRWDEKRFPVLGLWRLLDGGADYPWFGSRRLIALEPSCDLPSLTEAAARGTAVVLAPGERVETRFEATLFRPFGPVTDVQWGGGIR